MSEDLYDLDGNVRVAETITYYRYVPQRIYEINMVLKTMDEEQQIKVIKYIVRLTGKRDWFRSLARKKSKQTLFKEWDKIAKRSSNK